MSWYEKLLDTVKDVAPTLAGGAATAISGGNIGAGALVSSIVGKVVGKQGVDLEDASEMILGDPSKVMEFRSRMRDAEIKELEIRTKDVQSARDLLGKSRGPVILSILIVSAFCALLALVCFASIPPASANIAFLLMGTLAAEFTRVCTFWLGSSQSSKDKDEALNKFAEAAQKDQQARKESSTGLYNNISKGK